MQACELTWLATHVRRSLKVIRQIARDLGVKYILEGSARRSDKRLRVNVQLINAAEGGDHVWAERFDREIADIFEVQDEVTRRVVEAISGKIGETDISARSRPSNLEAYDLCVRSRHRISRSKSEDREGLGRCQRRDAGESLRRRLVGGPQARCRCQRAPGRQHGRRSQCDMDQHDRRARTNRGVARPRFRSGAAGVLLWSCARNPYATLDRL
jgi:hypothetical protein